MNRISMSDLRQSIIVLNNMTGSKTDVYTKTKDSTGLMVYTPNKGTYYLDGAYGGWKLARNSPKTGHYVDVLRCGYIPKRELYSLIRAYMDGIDAILT